MLKAKPVTNMTTILASMQMTLVDYKQTNKQTYTLTSNCDQIVSKCCDKTSSKVMV